MNKAAAFGSPPLPRPASSPCRGRERGRQPAGLAPDYARLSRTWPDYPGLGRTIPDYAGLGRTIPDYPGQERAETGRKHPENHASIRSERTQAVENTGLAKPRGRRHPFPTVRARRFPVHDAPFSLPLRTMRPRARRVKRTMVRGTISGRWQGAVGQGLGGVGVSTPARPPGPVGRGAPRKRFRGITSPRRRVVPDIAAAGRRKAPRICGQSGGGCIEHAIPGR